MWYGEGCPAEPPYDGFEAITASTTLYRGFRARLRMRLKASDCCRQGSKSLGDPEVDQGPYFLDNTPLGDVFQKQAMPLSEDIKGL